jgi:cardiolipin synthase
MDSKTRYSSLETRRQEDATRGSGSSPHRHIRSTVPDVAPRLHPKYRFPLRCGSRFELLVDGGAFFPAMLDAIEAAQRFVWLEMYLFESGGVATRFIESMTRAAQRGVDVRVLLDDFGAYRLASQDRRRLIDSGAKITFYNPLHLGKWLRNMFRDHRKLLVVDGEVAFVGGAGVTDDFDPRLKPALYWRDTMVCIRGLAVNDWQVLFAGLWDRQLGRTPSGVPTVVAVSDGAMCGRVAITAGPMGLEIKRSVLSRIQGARRRVWISTAYFVPTRKLRRALRGAARKGVDVRLLLPGPYTDHPGVRHAGRRFYTRLLRDGVRIFEYQPRMLHSKAVLCDEWASVGSSNLDRWNLRWNLEANQEVRDLSFAETLADMFESDFRRSAALGYEDWIGRPWYARLRERFWGTVDMWLLRLSQLRSIRGKRGGPRR